MKKLLSLLAVACALWPVDCPATPIFYDAIDFYSAIGEGDAPLTNSFVIKYQSQFTISGTALIGGPDVTITPPNGTNTFNLKPGSYQLYMDAISVVVLFDVPNATNTLNLVDLINYGAGIFTYTNNANFGVAVTTNDTNPSQLANKIMGDTNYIGITILNPGGNEQLQIKLNNTNLNGLLSRTNLPSDVPLTDTNNSFTGTQTFSNLVVANGVVTNSFSLGPFLFLCSTNALVSTNAGTAAANGNWTYLSVIPGYTNYMTFAYRKFVGGQWSTYSSAGSELYRGTNGTALGITDTPINGAAPGPGFSVGWIFYINTGTTVFNTNSPLLNLNLSGTFYGPVYGALHGMADSLNPTNFAALLTSFWATNPLAGGTVYGSDVVGAVNISKTSSNLAPSTVITSTISGDLSGCWNFPAMALNSSNSTPGQIPTATSGNGFAWSNPPVLMSDLTALSNAVVGKTNGWATGIIITNSPRIDTTNLHAQTMTLSNVVVTTTNVSGTNPAVRVNAVVDAKGFTVDGAPLTTATNTVTTNGAGANSYAAIYVTPGTTNVPLDFKGVTDRKDFDVFAFTSTNPVSFYLTNINLVSTQSILSTVQIRNRGTNALNFSFVDDIIWKGTAPNAVTYGPTNAVTNFLCEIDLKITPSMASGLATWGTPAWDPVNTTTNVALIVLPQDEVTTNLVGTHLVRVRAAGAKAYAFVGGQAIGKIWSSDDGLNFVTNIPTSASHYNTDIADDRTNKVVCGLGGAIMVSSNMTIWADRTGTNTGDFNAAIYAMGMFVLVGNNIVAVSTDHGQTFTEKDLGGDELKNISCSGTNFVAASPYQIYTSVNGLTWTTFQTPYMTGGALLYAVCWDGMEYDIAGSGGWYAYLTQLGWVDGAYGLQIGGGGPVVSPTCIGMEAGVSAVTGITNICMANSDGWVEVQPVSSFTSWNFGYGGIGRMVNTYIPKSATCLNGTFIVATKPP